MEQAERKVIMDLSMLAGPIIGAIIGCFTNYIAVKMLFRPWKAVKIGKFTLPFTPGIIPKEKEHIGKAVGAVIAKELLNKEVLAETFLSEERKESIRKSVRAAISKMETDERTVRDLAGKYVDKDRLEDVLDSTGNKVSGKISEKLIEMNLGNILAEETKKYLKEKLSGKIFGKLLSNELFDSVSAPLSSRINDYVEKNGKQLIEPPVKTEINHFMDYPLYQIAEKWNGSKTDPEQIVLSLYEQLVREKLPELLEEINISEIVESKINAMKLADIEKMILTLMKKELNAVVGLGAVIGFILGIVNAFI